MLWFFRVALLEILFYFWHRFLYLEKPTFVFVHWKCAMERSFCGENFAARQQCAKGNCKLQSPARHFLLMRLSFLVWNSSLISVYTSSGCFRDPRIKFMERTQCNCDFIVCAKYTLSIIINIY